MSTSNETPRPRALTSTDGRIAGVATAGGAGFLVLLASLHIVRPDLDPTWRFISEYALGTGGFLMTVAFLLAAVACSSLAVLAWRLIRTRTGRIGAVLAAVSAVGMLIAAIFETDPITTPASEATFSGTMHLVGGQLNLTPLALLFLTLGARRSGIWSGGRVPLWIITAGTLASGVAFAVTAASAGNAFGPGGYAGLFGRLLMLGFCAWVIVAGAQAVRAASSPRSMSLRAEPSPVE